MEESIRLEEEKARLHGKAYNWETATYGNDNDIVNMPSFSSPKATDAIRRILELGIRRIDYLYSIMEEHCEHLALVLQVMHANSLFAKKSKCSFTVSQVEYLGHIIFAQGISINPTKIEAMQEWLTPTTVKQLRGFLGLTGYYKRFIKNYARKYSVSVPALHKKPRRNDY
nr:Ty3/gypsy retrotransposon protein [Tanacetum cinerariifolium]